MEDQSARSKVHRSANRHVRMQCSINVTAIFPRLSCRKAVQRTDDHLRRVFCAPRSIPAFPHAPPGYLVIVVGPGIGLPGPILFLRAECGLRPPRRTTAPERRSIALTVAVDVAKARHKVRLPSARRRLARGSASVSPARVENCSYRNQSAAWFVGASPPNSRRLGAISDCAITFVGDGEHSGGSGQAEQLVRPRRPDQR